MKSNEYSFNQMAACPRGKYSDESQKMLRRAWKFVSSGQTDSTQFKILPTKL